jgi:hypothetical protein
MILSAAAWPTYPDVRLNLPDEVATQIERFDQFYKNKHTGRVLTWKHSLAHCSIKGSFAKGSKELLVSAYQAVVLIMFNSVPADGFLAYEQIATGTGLQGGDLDRTLQSLACGKSRVLTKHPKGREVKPTDTFTFNKTFTDPKYRVKINQIQLKETKAENKATHERIVQDRRFETQAAIVRIMKSRKSMGHSDLVAEVINLTKKRGMVDTSAIKKEIERYAKQRHNIIVLWLIKNAVSLRRIILKERATHMCTWRKAFLPVVGSYDLFNGTKRQGLMNEERWTADLSAIPTDIWIHVNKTDYYFQKKASS